MFEVEWSFSLDSGPWTLDLGLWALDFGLWTEAQPRRISAERLSGIKGIQGIKTG